MRVVGTAWGEAVEVFGQYRYFGPMGDQVGFLCAFFAVWSIAEGRIFGAVLHICALMATATRGALLTLLVALIIAIALSFFRGRDRKSYVTILVACAALVVSFVLATGSSTGQTLWQRLFTMRVARAGLMQRVSAIRIGVWVFQDNPVLGVGHGGFRFCIPGEQLYMFFGKGVDAARATFTTQNQTVQMAVDGGLPLLFGWVLFGLSLSRRALCKLTQYEQFGVAVASWIVAMFLGNQGAVWVLPFAASGWLFSLLAGVVASSGWSSLSQKGRASFVVGKSGGACC